MARSKVKSRSYHDSGHIQPLTNVHAKYQLLTPNSFQDIARQDCQTQCHFIKVKGQTKVTSLLCTPKYPNQCPHQVLTFYTLQFLRYSRDKIFKLKVTMARSKVKSRSYHDVAHLDLSTNVPTRYQHSTPSSS